MRAGKIYDFMAVVISDIVDNVSDDFLQKYHAMAQEKRIRLNEELKNEFSELYSDDYLSIEKLEDKAFFDKLDRFRKECTREGEYDKLINLLSKLDLTLKMQIDLYIKCFEEEKLRMQLTGKLDGEGTYGCLNSNVEECSVQLLPRCSCQWMHNSRDDVASVSLNNFLNSCYYVCMEFLNGYKINHLYFYNKFVEVAEEKCLKVGITPLFNGAEINVVYPEVNGVNRFEITEVMNTDDLAACALKQLELAREEGVDILCYPEMLGTEKVMDALQGKLKEFPDGKGLYPSLIVCPSIWKENKNICHVLDRNGNLAASQEKQYPFPYVHRGIEYLENIKPDKTVNILHCNGPGRIAVLICKDALQRKHLYMLLEHLKVTLILIPSFSTGNYDFGEIIQMCRAYDCCAVWINTCSAQHLEEATQEKLERIGLVVRTGKNSSGLQNENCDFIRKNKGCNGEGTQDCANCLYVQRL